MLTALCDLGVALHDGVALVSARCLKERTYPELTGRARVRQVVLAGEVGGRWSWEDVNVLGRSQSQGKATWSVFGRPGGVRSWLALPLGRLPALRGGAAAGASSIWANPILDLMCVMVGPRRGVAPKTGASKGRALKVVSRRVGPD